MNDKAKKGLNKYLDHLKNKSMSKKLFSQIKGCVHDASGIVLSPHSYYWKKTNGIYYPLIGYERPEIFARKCSITGKGMNEGYCLGDGEIYFSEEKHLINHLRNVMGVDPENKLSDEFILNESFNNEEYYHTTWEPDPINEECYDANGKVVSTPPTNETEKECNVRAELIAILDKIKENTIDAWEDSMEETKSVVILEDFDKGPEDFIYKYNGWIKDLINLKNKL
jgi:hypothetical protein